MSHCHLHPLQAAKCYRNYRLVVDEDDLKWMVNEKYISRYYWNSPMKILVLKPVVFREIKSFLRDSSYCFEALKG